MQTEIQRKKISFLIPCYNEEENVIPLSEAIIAQTEKLSCGYDYELIFIDNCSTDGTRAKLEQLWGEFADVPMNPETEEMEEPFLHFPVGTNREEIWHWFDERHSKGVVYLLYGTEPKYSLKNMAPLVRAQSLCCECDSETCVFNPKGICMIPFVTGNAPGLSEDGCTDYCYKEEDR